MPRLAEEVPLPALQEDLAWLEERAQGGNAEAQLVRGQQLLDGSAGGRDPEQALHWFLRAAHRGHPMAMNLAGRCHEQGWGTARDDTKAVHWYRLAEREGLAQARYNLANMLAAGRGVEADPAKAFALYRQAADQGFVKAFAKLGRYHEDGSVVPRDPARAFELYRRGAEGGDFRGQFCLAGMLAAQGREAEALGWLARVPETATRRYLRDVGAALALSACATYREVGERFQVLAAETSNSGLQGRSAGPHRRPLPGPPAGKGAP